MEPGHHMIAPALVLLTVFNVQSVTSRLTANLDKPSKEQVCHVFTKKGTEFPVEPIKIPMETIGLCFAVNVWLNEFYDLGPIS